MYECFVCVVFNVRLYVTLCAHAVYVCYVCMLCMYVRCVCNVCMYVMYVRYVFYVRMRMDVWFSQGRLYMCVVYVCLV